MSPRSANQELLHRWAVAAFGIPLAVWVVWEGGWTLAAVLAVAAGLSARETFALAKLRGLQPFGGLGVGAASALVLVAGAAPSFSEAAPLQWGLVSGLVILSLILALFLRWPGGSPLGGVAVTLLGSLYPGACLSFGVFLRHLPPRGGESLAGTGWEGALPLLAVLAVTWTGDALALFLGRRFGRKKLLPQVSPHKTVVGSFASLAGSLLLGGVLGWAVLRFHPSPSASILLGALLGLLLSLGAQLGDLAESALKREAGVKDSGRLLPGHGGALDRFDALLVNFPLAFLFFVALEFFG